MGKKLMLNEEGAMVPFREDREASEKAYASAGVTRQDVEKERNLKRAASQGKMAKGKVASMLSDEELATEMAKRKKSKKVVDEAMQQVPVVDEFKEGTDFNALTIPKIKEHLDAEGIFYPASATKPKLVALAEAGKQDDEVDEDETGTDGL